MNPFRSPPAKLFSVDSEKLKNQFKTGQRCNACGTKIWSKNPGKISKSQGNRRNPVTIGKNDVTLNITAAMLQLDFGIYHDETSFAHRFSDRKDFFICNSERDEFFFHYTKTGGLYKSEREELSTQTLFEARGKSSN